jgi:hypothetical protein
MISSFFSRRWLVFCFTQLITGVVLLGCQTGPVSSEDKSPLGKVVICYEVPQSGGEPKTNEILIYRCTTPNGPFQPVVEEPVLVPESKAGEICELFTDTSVLLGEDYYYYLESIDQHGKARKITPITKVKVTVPLKTEKKRPGNKTQ